MDLAPNFASSTYTTRRMIVENRINAMRGASDNIDLDVVEELLSMLDKNNDGRPNHITPSDEVVAFIVSDDTDTRGFRDTVMNSKQEGLKRIYETNSHFMQDNRRKPDPIISCLTPHLAGRLWQQYVVDQFSSIEQYRLDGVSTHQTPIRADLYNSVRDALNKGDHDPMHVGKAVILPASFTGSQRYMSQYFKDSLTICRAIGHPSFFLTMTCNSKWPEIQEMLKFLPNVDPVDAPDIVSRVFKLKIDQLLDLIKKRNYFGKCIGIMHVIEFQKRDKNSDPIAYEAVKKYMMHGPYEKDLYTSPCMVKGKCMRHFPKSPRSLKYLFKYYLKGHDTATMFLKKKSNKSGNEKTARSVKNLNEVKNFLDGRYVCASRRIFGFDIHHHSLSVERLPIHLPGQNYLNFQSSADLENVCNNATSKKSKLEAWFLANSEFPQAQNFTYSDFPTHFTRIKKTAKWKLRQRGDVVGRCKGALSFTQLRTIDGTTYDTFKEACGALGLLNNDKQWHDALEENAFSAMATQIRAMFVNILENCSVSDPLVLWENGQHSKVKGAICNSLTDIAELMQHTSLIIWDEGPIQHRYTFEVVDRSLRDIMASVDVERGKIPFGGITNLAEMEALMFELILSPDKSRSYWKIKERVTRMWPTLSSESGIRKGWNLILLDDDNTHIHAFAFADTWK
ncbi:uncharacterized protein LOC141715116 [Apium graveolens]|uniref:uncharacterized protein LOC141715116 n=1 Tax=Apium graveolens TaxID=4045 RepID=UPI003D7B8003